MASHVKKRDASIAVNNAIIQMLRSCSQLEVILIHSPPFPIFESAEISRHLFGYYNNLGSSQFYILT